MPPQAPTRSKQKVIHWNQCENLVLKSYPNPNPIYSISLYPPFRRTITHSFLTSPFSESSRHLCLTNPATIITISFSLLSLSTSIRFGYTPPIRFSIVNTSIQTTLSLYPPFCNNVTHSFAIINISIVQSFNYVRVKSHTIIRLIQSFNSHWMIRCFHYTFRQCQSAIKPKLYNSWNLWETSISRMYMKNSHLIINFSYLFIP